MNPSNVTTSMLQNAHEILKKRFGYDQFRPMQEDIIETVLHKKDALVLMPTGGGKSLCFQIPALLMDGVTIVISPLISLMKDQVTALQSNGIKAAFYNSSVSTSEQQKIVTDVLNGEIKLLYISPERLITAYEHEFKNANICMVAVDEAHCVSMWGHDFRPEYAQLAEFRKKLSHIPFMALTATADKATRTDIATQIGLQDPEVFVSSFNRPNLSLEVRSNVSKKKKIAQITDFIRERKDQSGIIYCLSRKSCEELSKSLTKAGIEAGYYHAGMNTDKRASIQDQFINDDLQIICATVAFGMGIDKSNVRWVIHYNLPKNMEGYYQEIGRAGRDGLASDTLLYFNIADLMILNKFALEGGQSELLVQKLRRMQQYSEATSCRRRILLAYFGEHLEEPCGNCDVCLSPPEFIDGTIIAQKALSATARLREEVGSTMLINVLRGSRNQEIREKGYDQIKTYGAGSDFSFFDWQNYLTQLLNVGVLELAYAEGFTFKITPFGKQVLAGEKEIQLTKPILPAEKVKQERAAEAAAPRTGNEAFFDKLRTVRKNLAVKMNVPAYVIFHDSTLWEFVHHKPLTEADFLAISGVSETKKKKYGAEFLEAIQMHLDGSKSTFDITYQLYTEGWTIEEICERRDMQPLTIFSHLAKLYSDGHAIDLAQYVTQMEIDLVRETVASLNGQTELKEISSGLKESIAPEKIRLALAILDSDRKKNQM